MFAKLKDLISNLALLVSLYRLEYFYILALLFKGDIFQILLETPTKLQSVSTLNIFKKLTTEKLHVFVIFEKWASTIQFVNIQMFMVAK